MISFEDKRSRPHFDFILLINMYILMIVGVISISVANFNPAVSLELPLLNRILASDSGSWQAIFVVASPAAIWFIVSIPYEHFKSFSPLYYVIIAVLLAVVSITSSAIREVRAWFQVGSLGRMLQPSEFAKITLILMLGKELSQTEKPLGSLRSFVRVGFIALLPAGLTYLQGETGNVMVMLGVTYLLLFFAGVDWKIILSLTVLVLLGLAAILAYSIISGSTNYQLLRILSFIDPSAYELDAGYQALRSQQAIGAGGLSGVGLFVPGSLSQLKFVPENWTDFIFATIGEAVGFIGSTIIVLLFLILILRMLYLSRFTYDAFGRLLIIGVMSMLFIHVFQNIAMTIGLMPITGIPLPFVSYGGSNLLTNIIGVSLVLNVTKNRTAAMPSYHIMAGETLRSQRKGRSKRKPIYVHATGGRRQQRRQAIKRSAEFD